MSKAFLGGPNEPKARAVPCNPPSEPFDVLTIPSALDKLGYLTDRGKTNLSRLTELTNTLRGISPQRCDEKKAPTQSGELSVLFDYLDNLQDISAEIEQQIERLEEVISFPGE